MKVRYRKTYYAVSLLFGDLFMILAALKFTFWLKFSSGLLPSPFGMPDYQIYAQVFAPVILVMLFVFRATGLYIEEKIASWMEEIALVLKAVSVSMVLVMGASFFFRDESFSRGYLLTAWFVIPFFVITIRILLGYAYMIYRRRAGKLNEILVIGASPTAARYAIRHRRRPRLCRRVTGFLDDRFPERVSYRRIPVLGRIADLENVLARHGGINEVIVALEHIRPENLMRIMTACEKRLVTFKWVPDVLGMVATQMQVRHDQGLPLLCLKESPLSEWENRLLKRAMDVAVAAFGLLILSPLMLLTALLVKLESRGGALYRQERVGEDGRRFWLYKFRTMRPDAESETGPVWARENDARCTRLGRFLRQSNLDELPQLWNVFKGDMSLVGPRPERPVFVGQFREDIPRYMGRHQIKSGITGWAQVNGLRGNTSIEERTKYDLFYIENWSILLDLKILLMTPFAFKNAY